MDCLVHVQSAQSVEPETQPRDLRYILLSSIPQKLRLVEVERLSEPPNLPDLQKRVVFTSDKVPSAESFRWIMITMDRYINLITCPLDGKWTRSKIHLSFNCFGGEITSLSASPSSLAANCADKTIRIVSLSKSISPSMSKPRWQGIKARVTCVQWHPASTTSNFGELPPNFFQTFLSLATVMEPSAFPKEMDLRATHMPSDTKTSNLSPVEALRGIR